MTTCERDRFHPEEMDTDDLPGRISRPDRERLPGGIASVSARLGIGLAVAACDRCAATGRTCPSCVQRRHYAWSLVMVRKCSLETAAGIMGLESDQVRELMIAEQDRQELRGLRCDSIPVHRTEAVIADALARDPNLTLAVIAHWLEMPQADFERAFLGGGRAGRIKRRVTVANASRLMIALGRAPNELEGC